MKSGSLLDSVLTKRGEARDEEVMVCFVTTASRIASPGFISRSGTLAGLLSEK